MIAIAGESLLTSGFLAWVGMMLVAVATAQLLLRCVPAVRDTLLTVESNRLVSVDGLRGVLGLSVMVHHAAATWVLLQTGQWALPQSRFLVHTGQTAVALFFMITAFLFWARVLERRDRMEWGTFFVSRVFRLYPVYLVALGIVVLASLTVSQTTGHTGPLLVPLVKWLSMLGSPDLVGVDSGHMIADVAWTLRYEWFFYIALPVLALLVSRQNPLVALVCVLVLAGIFLASSKMVDPGIALSFLGGIAAAHAVRFQGLVALARGRSAAGVALTALAGVLVLSDSGFGVVPTLGLGLFFVIVAAGNDLFGMLARPGLLWLGEITYSIYLFHGLVLWLMSHVLQRLGIEDLLSYSAVLVPVTALVVVLASGMFLYVERPGILAGRRITKAMKARRSSAQGIAQQ